MGLVLCNLVIYLITMYTGWCEDLIVLLFQTQLYEDFAKSRAKQGVEDSVTLLESTDNKERKSAGATHVFQVCGAILLLVLIIKKLQPVFLFSHLMLWLFKRTIQFNILISIENVHEIVLEWILFSFDFARHCSIWGSCAITLPLFWLLVILSMRKLRSSSRPVTPPYETVNTHPNWTP